ncbi:hypothetical protein HIN55_09310 [Salmonella enterica subsp. enterica serovar Typhimurium]|nr:hypothetical protein [Salmonella enterica subsp. enterica serovar Typhimurium]
MTSSHTQSASRIRCGFYCRRWRHTVRQADRRAADGRPRSPDTPEAQMWGHMADTLTVGDMKFQRPKLAAEATAATRTQEQDNETWARVRHMTPHLRLRRIGAGGNGKFHAAVDGRGNQ